MADSEQQQVSSTTSLLNDEVHHYEPEPDHFSPDDIVDLIGGAQDALQRHIAEDRAPHEFTGTWVPPVEHPVTLPEPAQVPEPKAAVEPLVFVPVVETIVKEPEPVVVPKPEPALPDSTSRSSFVLEPSVIDEEFEVAEPESTTLVQAPPAAPEPEPEPAPVRVSDALPAAEPRKEAPAPVVKTAEQPAVPAPPPAPASYVPSPPKAQPHPLMQFPTEHWDSPFLTSQDNSKVSMDPFSKDKAPISTSRFESNLQGNNSDEDDDLMYEVKKNNNPFEGFSPLADSGYSHFGDSKSDSRASKLSESPTPDLVQYGQTGESLDSPPSFLDEGETGKAASDYLMQSLNQFSSGVKEFCSDLKDEEEDEEVLPTSLPDILKSSPLNPDKIDSGSSEGSPEDQSPILERRMMESPNPPINLSVNNPFVFDGKVSLLKEMAEELEVRSAEKPEDDKTFGAFDLVKEAEETTPTKIKNEEPVKIEQKDWFSGLDSPKKAEKFEPLDFKNKNTTAEDSDSESPTADSLSPVLEAMAKNPASFQVETEKKDVKLDEPEMAEEVSEHEVSSEEFEFIERPPRGVIDEFLEALDTSKFASSKAPELPMDDDLTFGTEEVVPVSVPPPTKVSPSLLMEEEVSNQSSYRLLTQSSPQKSKAELEKLDIQQPPPQAPLTHSPVQKPEGVATKKSAQFKMPNLNIEAVVDLLYWRDVKTTGVVFGATMLLLLSLTMCSIVSVCSYIGLALLSVTICFRIYKGILQAIQKSDEGHPFKQYLEQEVALSEDMVHNYSDKALAKINKTIGDLRRLFLVEDLVDSIKFAVLMWILTYVGAMFNGLTLVILAVVGAFSCPIVYEKHQDQIDHYVGLVNNQIKDIVGKIQAKVPGMKRKAE